MEIKIRDLEMSYQMCVYGYNEPDKLLAPRPFVREYVRMVISNYRGREWPSWLTKFSDCYTFNNAKVIECPLVPEGHWVFINTTPPAEVEDKLKGRFSGIFNPVDGLKWHSVPQEILDFVAATKPPEVKTRFPEGAEL